MNAKYVFWPVYSGHIIILVAGATSNLGTFFLATFKQEY